MPHATYRRFLSPTLPPDPLARVPSRRLRWGAVALASLGLHGCLDVGAFRANLSGKIGCPPEEIVLPHDIGTAPPQFTVECRGQRFFCSYAWKDYTCTPETAPREATAERAAPQPPRDATSPPPQGAAGFTLGADAKAVEKLCADAGLTWSPAPGGRFSCSGAPTDVGFPTTTTATLCDGKLCGIALDAARDGSPWPDLVKRFTELLGSLEAKYGHPQAQATKPIDDCTETTQTCFEKGRVKTLASWKWANGDTIELTLSGGAPGSRPELWIVYHRPNDAPKASAL
jgi:hypothetical protein